MRENDVSRHAVSNGRSTSSNGSTPKKATLTSLNGHSPHATNGSSSPYTNGTSKRRSPTRNATYRGHDREEVTRILLQGLMDMGYTDAAEKLRQESGYELESKTVATFRNSVLGGDWSQAESILLGEVDHQNGSIPEEESYGTGIVLADGADKAQMLLWIRQQKYLELLDRRDLGMALMVLRQELTPLNNDTFQLHALSSLLMCPPEDLRSQAHWPDSVQESRAELLADLTKAIAPSVMIRDHRLAELLDQVKQAQINQCLYHNTSVSPSLYSDHLCPREEFPSRTWLQLSDHTGEVWHVQFSPDGKKLATASEDKSVCIYETTTFKRILKLTAHNDHVLYIAWSPDSSKLITCSKDTKARVWDVSLGRVIMTVEHRTAENHFISSASWLPDSQSFVTSSHDRQAPLCHWSLRRPDTEKPLRTWPDEEKKLRVGECAVTRDGQRIVAIDANKTLYVFDMQTYREEYRRSFPTKITAVGLSRDSQSMIVNVLGEDVGEVHLVEVATGETIRKFRGQHQGTCIIRNSFGGAGENFVLSGSENGKIYVWHRENGALIEALSGHEVGASGKNIVTSVSWNPCDPGMFASGGDDRRVRIWTNAFPVNDDTLDSEVLSIKHDGGRTSALRSTYRGDSNL